MVQVLVVRIDAFVPLLFCGMTLAIITAVSSNAGRSGS